MAIKLKKRTVVIVGGGLAAGLIARQLVAKGLDVLVLERGHDRRAGPEAKIPTQRDELRWSVNAGLAQDWAVETYTLRHSTKEEALPVRRMAAFLPGEGMGGAANHWNGQTWRWAEYDPILRTHLATRYGAKSIPADMPIQDWGITYAEMEPYHELFERLFGIAGKAGNIKGQVQPGGNPFEAPRRGEYPQPPLESTEAGLIFKAGVEKLGYKPFTMPAANSPGAYTNPDGMRLGPCQYCGHCERFICEAQAKATPSVLLYPMLLQKPGFEFRERSHVLGVDYDRQAKRVRSVRYLDLASGEEYEQPADIVVLAAFTMSNTKLLLMAGIGRPYDPKTGRGVVGRNFCYQTMSSATVFFKDRWINPFLAAGSTGTVIDDFNNDNFDHSGLGFHGGGYIGANVSNGRPISARHVPPGTPRWGTAWKQANADWYAHSFSVSVHGSGLSAMCAHRHRGLTVVAAVRRARAGLGRDGRPDGLFGLCVPWRPRVPPSSPRRPRLRACRRRPGDCPGPAGIRGEYPAAASHVRGLGRRRCRARRPSRHRALRSLRTLGRRTPRGSVCPLPTRSGQFRRVGQRRRAHRRARLRGGNDGRQPGGRSHRPQGPGGQCGHLRSHVGDRAWGARAARWKTLAKSMPAADARRAGTTRGAEFVPGIHQHVSLTTGRAAAPGVRPLHPRLGLRAR